MERIILDCDPGMDDSVAILLACASSNITLEAVTAVNGNYPIDVSLKNVCKTLELVGRSDVTAARGMSHPMVRKSPKDPFSHGADGQADADLPEPTMLVDPRHAVEVIHDIVSRNPGEITIVATGPLSNVGMAISMYPQIIPQIKEIVAISGAYGLNQASFLNATGDTPQSEWNVYVDPEAAKLVYESGIPLKLIGLDIATDFGVDFTEEQVSRLTQSENPAAKFLVNAMSFVKNRGFGYYCAVIDAMAVAYVSDREIIQFKPTYVGVDTRDGLTLGMTVRDGRHHFMWSDLPLVDIAVHANYSRFLEKIISSLIA